MEESFACRWLHHSDGTALLCIVQHVNDVTHRVIISAQEAKELQRLLNAKGGPLDRGNTKDDSPIKG